MDDQTERAPARARVRFGTKPHQTIPFEYAERIIMILAAKALPNDFTKTLSKVTLDDLAEGRKTDGGGLDG